MSFFATRASADNPARQDLSALICSALIALPFLFPIAAGPSFNVWQQLFSWLCVASLCLLVGSKHLNVRRILMIWLAVSAALIAVFRSPLLGLGSWLSGVVAVSAICMAAFAGAGLVHDHGRVRNVLANGLFLAGAISAVLGLLQYYELAGMLWPWTTEPGAGQAFGNLRQRNQFASLMSMSLIAALWLHAGYWSDSLKRRLLWRGAILLLLAAVAASTSRTGLLEIVAIASAAAFLARRERRPRAAQNTMAVIRLPAPWVLLSWIPLYFAIAWLLPQLTDSNVDGMMRRLSEGAPVGHSRLILWHNVLTLIAERPWTGWGWGELSFAHYTHSALYLGPRFVEILDNAHNLPLHLAVELGIPAALVICGGFLWLVIAAKPWRESEPLRIMAWGLLGVIVLHSLLEYPLWYGPFQLIFGLCLGVLWLAKCLPGVATQRRWAGVLPVLVTASVTLIAIVGYASWDYLRIGQIYLPRDERLPPYKDNTLAKIQGSWLFANQVRFAELTLSPVTPANAREVYALANRTLHFSPEPRVIIKLIESAELSDHHAEASLEAERFSIAFPLEYELWVEGKPIDSAAP